MKKLKNSILTLCALTALAGGAYAQSTGIAPPPSSNTPTASPTTTLQSTLQSQDPAKTDIVNPIEDAKTHDSVLNGVNKDDVSNAPDPLDPTLDPLDGRNKLEPTTPSQVTPISPSPEQPVRTAPLLESPSSIKDSTTTTSPARGDVSNVEESSSSVERSSSIEYKPSGNYDTDGDGQLDTNEMLKGPIQPVAPTSDTNTQPTP